MNYLERTSAFWKDRLLSETSPAQRRSVFAVDAPPSGRVRGAGTFQPPSAFDLDDDIDRNPQDDDNLDEESEEEDLPYGLTPLKFDTFERKLRLDNAPPDTNMTGLINRWKKSRDPNDLEPILAEYKPALDAQIRKLNSFRLPKGAIHGAVHNAFVQSLDKWDADKGGNPATYFQNSQARTLYGDMRTTAQFGQAVRSRVSKMERIHAVSEQLSLEDIDPTPEMIAARTNFSLKEVRKALAESSRDLLGSKDLGIGEQAADDFMLRRAADRIRDYHSSVNQRIITRMFGLDGKPPETGNAALAAHAGVSTGHVSNLKKKVQRDLVAELQRLGA